MTVVYASAREYFGDTFDPELATRGPYFYFRMDGLPPAHVQRMDTEAQAKRARDNEANKQERLRRIKIYKERLVDREPNEQTIFGDL